ncbi:hypothetical protein [uncultured Rhodoblastus sp.]|uniref:hypothetical protein n=1 Tax=uncultured Rhodoblastus sp. TaxID=543037 RepID=UPI0025FE65F2|nr:hypothetical protein [uncultured Rhodoblastus sp.]
MLNRRHIFRTAAAALAVLCLASSTPAFAGQGRVRLRFASAGFIVGIGGGDGTLTLNGRTFRLRIGGLNIGSIGASGGTLVGRAVNIRSPSDINGSFAAVGAGLTVAGGARVFRMQNSNGVILELRGTQMGFEANLGLSGFSLALQ